MKSGSMKTVVNLRSMPYALAVLLSVAPIGQSSATVLQVPGQFPNIQAAVDGATAGDTIAIANGTYSGTGNYDIDFHGKGLIVKSAGGAKTCIIDCKKLGRGFYLHSDEKPASQIEGITITNASVGSYGGGIYVDSKVDCTAVDCVFKNNSGFEGGGGMYYGKAIRCVFDTNSALLNKFAGTTVGHGGGAYRTVAIGCTFTANVAYNGGGGLANGTASKCTFIHNISTGNGGGAFDTTAVDCTFKDNRANGGGGVAYGAAVNCVFVENQAETCGGAVYNSNLVFCSIAGNIAVRAEAGGVYMDITEPKVIANCIVWGNKSGAPSPGVLDKGGKLKTINSDVEGGIAGTGNINTDPLFINAAMGDLHLKAGSPCIDAGKMTDTPVTDRDGNKRVIGSAPDMGAYEHKP